MSDTPCFRCDGTGKICNLCGESAAACSCDETEIDDYVAEYQNSNMDDCSDCEGSGSN